MKTNKKKKLLLLGTLTSEQQNKIFLSKGIRPAPADIVQKYLLDGLAEDSRIDEILFLGSPRILSYPYQKIIKVQNVEWKIKKGQAKSLGYLNLPVIGFKERELKLKTKAKKWAEECGEDQEMYVIAYSMHSPFLAAIKEMKKINPRIHTMLIVPDLPQYMSNANVIKRILKKIDMSRINCLLQYIDKYALYTKYMADYFNLKDNWIIFEGLMDTARISIKSEKKCKDNVCVYAGSLNRKYAIDVLVEAFSKLDNAELHLYGNREEAELLLAGNKKIDNVKYMGMLPQEQIFEVMKQAKLLLNPRPSSLELAKYSCPSKTFEYMASGTPVIMNKLPGLPEEYHPYIYFFESEDKEGFQNTLKNILSKSDEELYEFGRKAQLFLKNQKNNIVQARRILDFFMEDYDAGKEKQ